MRKIFIGPYEIAGYYASLYQGMRSLGVDCDYFTYEDHLMQYGGEGEPPLLLRISKYFAKFKKAKKQSILIRRLCGLPGELAAAIWGVYAIFKYDAFIFGFGRSLLRGNVDLPVLKWLGKTVVMNMAHGSESRPPYLDGSYQSSDGLVQPSTVYLAEATRKLSKKILFIEKNVECIVGAAFSYSQFGRKKFINTLAVGVPCKAPLADSTDALKIAGPVGDGVSRTVRILHSPSHPAVKGSSRIVSAVESLRKRGVLIDLVLIKGRPNHEVIEEIKRCDFVVDQLYSDTTMAGFATEAAWYGKPALVAGYGLNDFTSCNPPHLVAPAKICHPDDIEEVLEEFVIDVESRLDLGRRAHLHVKKNWTPQKVAERYLRLLEGDAPEEWWMDPTTVTYFLGCGQDRNITRTNVRALVTQFGVASLGLAHRPSLEKAVLQFAEI